MARVALAAIRLESSLTFADAHIITLRQTYVLREKDCGGTIWQYQSAVKRFSSLFIRWSFVLMANWNASEHTSVQCGAGLSGLLCVCVARCRYGLICRYAPIHLQVFASFPHNRMYRDRAPIKRTSNRNEIGKCAETYKMWTNQISRTLNFCRRLERLQRLEMLSRYNWAITVQPDYDDAITCESRRQCNEKALNLQQ